MKRVIAITVPARRRLGQLVHEAFTARVLVDIDVDGIARRLGPRAAESETGQAKALAGLVTVTYLGHNGVTK